MYYYKNHSVVCTELEGSAILLDLDTKYYYHLNETGVRIWQLIDSAGGAYEIAEKMSNEFYVDRSKALESVRRLIGDLEKNGLIVRQPR